MFVSSRMMAGGVFLRSPGRKKLAGETLWVVLIPLQPLIKITAGSIARNSSLPFNFN